MIYVYGFIVFVVMIVIFILMSKMGWNLDCKHEYGAVEKYYLSSKHGRLKKKCIKCGHVWIHDVRI